MKSEHSYLSLNYYTHLSFLSLLSWTLAALLHFFFLQETMLFRIFLSVAFFFWAFTRFILVKTMSTPPFHQTLVRIGGCISLFYVFIVWNTGHWITLDQLIGSWIIIHLVLRIWGYLLLHQAQFKIRHIFIVDFVFALPFGLILIFNPYQSDVVQSWFVLVFMLGSSMLQAYRHLIIKKTIHDKQKIHSTRLHIPIIVSQTLPSYLIHTINEWLLSNQRTVSNFTTPTQLTKRFYIYFVTNEKQQIRHSYVYVGFEGKVFHLLLLPQINTRLPWKKQGVMLTSDDESFTHRFGFKYKHKVTRFTLLISEDHANRIREQLRKLIVFSTPYDLQKINHRRSYLATKRILSPNCELRAINFEPFKNANPFLLSGVSFLRFVLKTSLWSALPFKGVLTPHFVYQFFEEQFTIPHSYVIGRVNVEND